MGTRTNWIFDREVAEGSRGVVSAKHPLAADVGAEILSRGGNAIDAAVATGFAISIVEPFMSGIGGGGYLIANLPATSEQVLIDYSMIAPAAASEEMYELTGGTAEGSLFGWPAVKDDANMVGHPSIATPGTVAGLAMALERYGTISLAEAIAPAIRLARDGFPVSWHTSLFIGMDLRHLSRFSATRDIFTVDGYPPSPILAHKIVQNDLAETLGMIAADGPDAFYQGALAEKIVAEVRANGGLLSIDDMANYQARVTEPLRGRYRDYDVLTSPISSGGPTILEILNHMDLLEPGSHAHNSPAYLHYVAEACRQAFVDRFAYLADPEMVDVPGEGLSSKEYAAERFAEINPERARGDMTPGDREQLGVNHKLDSSEIAYSTSATTTTHISVIDGDGNAVSITQTLLGAWGSRVVVPGTGVLMNNGMMWFDPEPGRPNSIAGGKRPLANMAPALLVKDGQSVLSVGAMGGRRIMSAVPQVIANIVDYGMSVQEAITAPRLDYSTSMLQLSDRIDAGTLESLKAMGHPVEAKTEDPQAFEFGSPGAVLREGTRITGGVNPYYPGMAVGVDDA